MGAEASAGVSAVGLEVRGMYVASLLAAKRKELFKLSCTLQLSSSNESLIIKGVQLPVMDVQQNLIV